jgi:hypothetical protein
MQKRSYRKKIPAYALPTPTSLAPHCPFALFPTRSQSVDNDMHRMDTPSKRTPVFGSIERGLDKVKTIFTPRKRLNIVDTPRKAKVSLSVPYPQKHTDPITVPSLAKAAQRLTAFFWQFCFRASGSEMALSQRHMWNVQRSLAGNVKLLSISIDN